MHIASILVVIIINFNVEIWRSVWNGETHTTFCQLSSQVINDPGLLSVFILCRACLASFLLSVCIFFDDFVSTLVIGYTSRKV